jgi:hypothetical protein
VKKRVGKRLHFGLDAQFGSGCMAFTENISEYGIYVKIACTEPTTHIKLGTMVNLIVQLPSGQLLELMCKKIWSNKNTPSSLIEHIGIQLINPPQDYIYFIKRLMMQKFRWQ